MSKKRKRPNKGAAKPAATEYITIPVAEYVYLHRVDALMGVLLQADPYGNGQTVKAVKDAMTDILAEAGAFQ